MDRATAKSELERIVPTSSDPALTADDINAALDAAKIIDADGNAPIDADYTETIDANYAIAEAFDLKAVRAAAAGQVEEFTAEGARFKRILPNFAALAARYRDRSTAGSDSSGISVIELHPETPDHLQPRSTRVDRH